MSNAPRLKGHKPPQKIERPVRRVLLELGPIVKPPIWQRTAWWQLCRLECMHDVPVQFHRGRRPEKAHCTLCKQRELAKNRWKDWPDAPAAVREGGELIEAGDLCARLVHSFDGFALRVEGLTPIEQRQAACGAIELHLRELVDERDIVPDAFVAMREGGSVRIPFLVGGLAVFVAVDGSVEVLEEQLERAAACPALWRFLVVSTASRFGRIRSRFKGIERDVDCDLVFLNNPA